LPVIQDEEFGQITIRRSAKANSIRLRVAPNGLLRISIPLYTPLFLAKRIVQKSRSEIRTMLQDQKGTILFENGMVIGKSHTLIVHPHPVSTTKVKREGQRITVYLSGDDTISDLSVQRQIRNVVIEAIRLEAKSYLPKRLAFLADKLGFSYKSLRFSHSSGRWGSCNSNGTISLNIALMRLPFELIDYVLIHELSHTHEMNHSSEFWQLVNQGDPYYKKHRASLKQESPSI
jgi:predicted metal-dependent hydrolase